MGTPQEEWQFQYGGADAGHTDLTVENLVVNNSLEVNGVPIAEGGATGATGAPGMGAYAHARVDENGNFIANRGLASCGLVTTGTYRYEFAQPMADENYSVLADSHLRKFAVSRDANDVSGIKLDKQYNSSVSSPVIGVLVSTHM